MGLAYVVIVLATSLAFLLLSPIAEHFDVSLAAVGWVVIIEGLVIVSLLLPIGGIADSIGRRRVMVGGLVLFAIGTLCAGLSPSFALLIVARLVMALGNTMVQAVGTGLLVGAFPPEERGIAMGAQTTAVAVGAASGPLVGGLLLRSLEWNTLFLLLAIPAVLSAISAFVFLPADNDDPDTAANDRFDDYVGASLSASAVVVLIVLISNPFGISFASIFTLAGWALFGVLATAFVRWELASPNPMLQLRLFENPTFRTAVIVRFLGFVSAAARSILLPVYLLSVRGFSSSMTGLVLALNAVGFGLSAQVAGRLYDRIGPRWPTTAGLALQAACACSLAFATTSTPLWILALLALGFGLAQSQWNVPNNSAIMGVATRRSLGVVGAFTNVARTLGSVLGQALGAAIVAGVMARQGFDIPLGDVGKVADAASSFIDGWTAAFLAATALAVIAITIGLRLPHGRPEQR